MFVEAKPGRAGDPILEELASPFAARRTTRGDTPSARENVRTTFDTSPNRASSATSVIRPRIARQQSSGAGHPRPDLPIHPHRCQNGAPPIAGGGGPSLAGAP